MKKILVVLLVIFVVGCAKKYVKAPGEPGTGEGTAQEKVMPEKEVVKEDIYAAREGEVIASEAELRAKEEAISKDVLFDFDKYDIRADARPILDAVASWMNKNKNVDILIEGHCDERGTNEYNLALGEKRAKATRDYLVSLGVSPERMSMVTYGEERPLCVEHNEECWQKNRRAHFVISK